MWKGSEVGRSLPWSRAVQKEAPGTGEEQELDREQSLSGDSGKVLIYLRCNGKIFTGFV